MKITGETFFVDTNVLIAVTDRSRASHANALRLFREIPLKGGHLAWSGQVVREYLVVATRPENRNGLGLSSQLALKNIEVLAERVFLLEEGGRSSSILKSLVAKHSLAGKRIHDANIAATMRAEGIAKLITDDTTDYQVFTEIETFRVDDLSDHM